MYRRTSMLVSSLFRRNDNPLISHAVTVIKHYDDDRGNPKLIVIFVCYFSFTSREL